MNLAVHRTEWIRQLLRPRQQKTLPRWLVNSLVQYGSSILTIRTTRPSCWWVSSVCSCVWKKQKNVCEKNKKYGNYLISWCASLFIIIVNSHSLSILRSSKPHQQIGNAIRCSGERGNIVNERQLQLKRSLPACRTMERQAVEYITDAGNVTNAAACTQRRRCCQKPGCIVDFDIGVSFVCWSTARNVDWSTTGMVRQSKEQDNIV